MASNNGFLSSIAEMRESHLDNTRGLKLDKLLAELERTDKKMVEEIRLALKDTRYSYDICSAALKKHGVDISPSGVRRWRLKYGVIQ